MFAKVLILALLGINLVSVDSIGTKSVSKAEIKQKFIESANKLARDFDEKTSKTYYKAQSKLDAILIALKGKNDEAVAIAEEKMSVLRREFDELVPVLKQSIEDTKATVLNEIEQLEGDISHYEYVKLRIKQKSILKEEEIKYKTQLKAWSKKAKDVREEAELALKEIELEEFLNQLKLKYGEIYEAYEERLIELKKKYIEVKKEGKIAVEELKLKYEKELAEVKDQPDKYFELLIKARIAIAAEKAKYKLQKEQVKQEVREIIRKMEIEQIEGGIEQNN